MKKNIYRVYFPRTGDWYNSEGKWYQLSTWLDDTIGYDWDYVDEHFEFSDESHKSWFMLRWQ